MNKLSIRKLSSGELSAVSLLQSIEDLFETIRQRAFTLFQERGGALGHDLEDWLRAENEQLWVPEAELQEDENQYRIRLAVPGVKSEDLDVAILPTSIVVQSESELKKPKDAGTELSGALSQKRLFRSFTFTEPIDTDKIQATLDKGILEITAAKATPAAQKKVAVQKA